MLDVGIAVVGVATIGVAVVGINVPELHMLVAALTHNTSHSLVQHQSSLIHTLSSHI